MGSVFKSQLCNYAHNGGSMPAHHGTSSHIQVPICSLSLDNTTLFRPLSILTILSSIVGFQRKPITLTSCELCHFSKAFGGQVEVLSTSLPFHLPSSSLSPTPGLPLPFPSTTSHSISNISTHFYSEHLCISKPKYSVSGKPPPAFTLLKDCIAFP